MVDLHRFGEAYRKRSRETTPTELCEICGAELEIDAESGEKRCPACEEMDQDLNQ